jgi:hypothetical protein
VEEEEAEEGGGGAEERHHHQREERPENVAGRKLRSWRGALKNDSAL